MHASVARESTLDLGHRAAGSIQLVFRRVKP